VKFIHATSGAVASILCACTSSEPTVPLTSGTYTFQHRDAEFPDSTGFPVSVEIDGVRVVVTNPSVHGPIPSGVIDRATLMWHAKTKQWLLGHSEADRQAAEVGGCTGGPVVVDFSSKTLWTCEGGP
jgi:hypothetical protein